MIWDLHCISIPVVYVTQGYDKGGSEMDFGMFQLGDWDFWKSHWFGWEARKRFFQAVEIQPGVTGWKKYIPSQLFFKDALAGEFWWLYPTLPKILHELMSLSGLWIIFLTQTKWLILPSSIKSRVTSKIFYPPFLDVGEKKDDQFPSVPGLFGEWLRLFRRQLQSMVFGAIQVQGHNTKREAGRTGWRFLDLLRIQKMFIFDGFRVKGDGFSKSELVLRNVGAKILAGKAMLQYLGSWWRFPPEDCSRIKKPIQFFTMLHRCKMFFLELQRALFVFFDLEFWAKDFQLGFCWHP